MYGYKLLINSIFGLVSYSDKLSLFGKYNNLLSYLTDFKLFYSSNMYFELLNKYKFYSLLSFNNSQIKIENINNNIIFNYLIDKTTWKIDKCGEMSIFIKTKSNGFKQLRKKNNNVYICKSIIK